ncbi:MAG: hypothetical protein GC192_22440 [Bacteroidetes bacterium]|nr:hypothetical protein [Bacteroidota bacterium]
MKAKFNCSQAVFIVIVDTVLNSLAEYLAAITAEIPKYDQTWIDDLRAMLTSAIALPTETEAQAVSSLIRANLAAQNATCCGLWQTLARRIKGAYPANEVKIRLSSAGQAKYETAYNENWPDTKSLLDSGKKFLAANLATLTANGNMNPSFATTFNDAADQFNTILSSYESSKETVVLATQTRIKAFNDIYDLLIMMMLDAEDIFQKNEAVRTQFVYSHVEERISGPGLAGARGTVTNLADSFPIEGALVEIWLEDSPATRYSSLTDSDGKYAITCPSGVYKFKVSAEHYTASEVKNISIAVGTVSAYNETLVAVDNG